MWLWILSALIIILTWAAWVFLGTGITYWAPVAVTGVVVLFVVSILAFRRIRAARAARALEKAIAQQAQEQALAAKPERVARCIGPAGVNRAFQIPRSLAGNRERQNLDPARRTVGQGRLERLVDFDGLAPHVLLVQHIEDAVGFQDRKHLGMGVDRERRAFAHRQQSGNRVDLAVGRPAGPVHPERRPGGEDRTAAVGEP